MSRAERACSQMPLWMLRVILQLPSRRDWWSAAYLEIWKREVDSEVELTVDDETGPWRAPPVHGRQ